MNFSDIQFAFNRALSLTFCKKKWALVFTVLVLCGLLVVFFRGLAIHAGQWLLLSLTFLPFFLCAGVLLSMGILLVRIYHDEIKGKEVVYKDVFGKSWEVMLGASYLSVPIILSYLLLWILLGVFVLLLQAPLIGDFFGVVLAFGPFLLNLGSIALALLSLAMLFFVTPIVALKGLSRIRVTHTLAERLKMDLFSNLILAFFALLPLISVSAVLLLAAFLTETLCQSCNDPFHNVLQWFFIMIPFTALQAPPVIFFFNFSAEAHVLLKRKDTKLL